MKEYFSVPNILSYIRIALVPVFAVLYLCGYTYWALGVFVIASLTDAADGFIARKYHLITNFGKIIDPFADKLLKITVLSCLVCTNVIPLWFLLTMLVLDLTLIIFGSVLFKQEVIIKSNVVGKAGTAIITLGIFLSFFKDFAGDLQNVYLIVLYCGLAVVFASAVSYLVTYIKICKTNKKG